MEFVDRFGKNPNAKVGGATSKLKNEGGNLLSNLESMVAEDTARCDGDEAYDIDGTSIDGAPFEGGDDDIDGMPISTDIIDGVPLDEHGYEDDIDGVAIDDDDIDGIAMDDDIDGASLSKKDSDDEDGDEEPGRIEL